MIISFISNKFKHIKKPILITFFFNFLLKFEIFFLSKHDLLKRPTSELKMIKKSILSIHF